MGYRMNSQLFDLENGLRRDDCKLIIQFLVTTFIRVYYPISYLDISTTSKYQPFDEAQTDPLE